MQLVNNTEEKIEIDPGQALTFSSKLPKFEHSLYRVEIESGVEYENIEDLTNPVDRHLQDFSGGE